MMTNIVSFPTGQWLLNNTLILKYNIRHPNNILILARARARAPPTNITYNEQMQNDCNDQLSYFALRKC